MATSSVEPEVVLYDLACVKNICFSPTVWRIRLMLNYKRIPYRTVFLEMPDIEPTLKELGIPPHDPASGNRKNYTVPAIQHVPTNKYIMDSKPIAEFLESTYPDPPLQLTSELGSEIELKLRTLIAPTLYQSIIPREINMFSPRAQEYFRRTREAQLGKKLEDLLAGEEERWKAADVDLRAISELMKRNQGNGPFVLGARPSYSDFFIAGSLQSLRAIEWAVFVRIVQYPGFREVYELFQPSTSRIENKETATQFRTDSPSMNAVKAILVPSFDLFEGFGFRQLPAITTYMYTCTRRSQFMETRTETRASEASPHKSRSSTPRRRKNGRYRRTPSKRHTPTPHSSAYRCSSSKSKSKTPQRSVQSPLRPRRRERQDEAKNITEDEDVINGKDEEKDEAKDDVRDEAREQVVGPIVSEKMLADMEAEKRQYLGTSLRWAPLEERLFEILFLRQEIPLLPSYWEEYFPTVPMPEACYCWRKDMNPVVYAHAVNTFRDTDEERFAATVALTKLIDLTADIRTICQSGLRSNAPRMIKKSLEKFLNWAAEDGGYRHLEYLPNIIVEIVEKHSEDMPQTAFVEMRMRDLARKHRKMLAIKTEEEDGAVEGDVDMEVERQIRGEAEASNGEEKTQQVTASRSRSWRMFGSRVMSRLFRLIGRRSVIKPEYHGETSVIESDADEPMTAQEDTPARDSVNVKQEGDEDEGIRLPIKRELHSESEDDVTMADIPLASAAATNSWSSPTLYHRQPPVIFGFFIVGTTAMLLTADSSKDEAAMHLTLQFDLDFENRSLGVWNALTVAIVACLARDDMMKRMGDFEEARVVEESDPDA
ncbi:hypothetical protein CCMA1212_002569 [Trichoderma ghanense]|uniref:GST N-terminal domain-containing protein n=1 Tax=Trichoderma ghanense TaxID=65468 RepID=A0ABY2HAJ9_9HYPO